jgi:hypothetical protein
MSTESEIVESIQKMQDVEQRLFNSLTTGASSGLSSAQQNAIISEINEVAQSRSSLYSALLKYYEGQQFNTSNVRQNLIDQKTVVGLFEKQLNDAKNNYNLLRDEAANKLRMVEINTYYGQKYQAYGSLMKIIILICAPILILAVLSRMNILSRGIAGSLSFLIVAIGAFFIVKRLFNIMARNNMTFDEYDWNFDPNKVVLSEHSNLNAPSSSFNLEKDVKTMESEVTSSFGLGCVDGECCSGGTKWDETTKRCVKATMPSNRVLTNPEPAHTSGHTTGSGLSKTNGTVGGHTSVPNNVGMRVLS